jgi:hypothetical protein
MRRAGGWRLLGYSKKRGGSEACRRMAPPRILKEGRYTRKEVAKELGFKVQ